MFVPRQLSGSITQLMKWFPVVSVTGPRQSGKSTLLREMFPDLAYLNLEDPGIRRLAQEDPVGFLSSHSGPLIIDEAQYAPDLFSVVQLRSDEVGSPGQYILSGSQNFLLMESIAQSLAGRVGISHLLPFGLVEARSISADLTVDEFMVRGGYPRLYQAQIPPEIYFENYVQTYLQRDVSGLLNVRNSDSFRRFIKVCALQAGNLINYSAIANEIDVSFQTVKNWVSILESSFIIFSLPSHHFNPRKVLTKTAKLYFYDTGLLCHLLGISSPEELFMHPQAGAVRENMVVAETMKTHIHSGRKPDLRFYRDSSKREVDLLDFTGGDPKAYEIKASQTYHSKYTRHLTAVGEELGIKPANRTVLYYGQQSFRARDAQIVPVEQYLQELH